MKLVRQGLRVILPKGRDLWDGPLLGSPLSSRHISLPLQGSQPHLPPLPAVGASGGAAPSPAQLTEQWRLLALLVRAITLVGLLAAAFGPGYAYLALLAAYSHRWASTSAPAVLGLYSQYIVLLAANGILEAFVHSVATQRQLQRINLWLVAFSALHLGASAGAVWAWGAAGLILADAANMAVRIAYCAAFVTARFRGVPGFALRKLLPARATLGALAGALALTGASRLLLLPESAGLWSWLRVATKGGSAPAAAVVAAAQPALALLGGLAWRVRVAAHVLVGAGSLAAVGGTVLLCEKDVVRQLLRVRGKAAASKEE